MAKVRSLAKMLGAVVMLTCAARADAAALPLVTNGASDYSIVTPEEPTVQEQFAAAELEKYLALISGAKLAVLAESKATGRKIIVAVAPRSKRAAKVQFAKGDADFDAFAIKADGDDRASRAPRAAQGKRALAVARPKTAHRFVHVVFREVRMGLHKRHYAAPRRVRQAGAVGRFRRRQTPHPAPASPGSSPGQPCATLSLKGRGEHRRTPSPRRGRGLG